MILFPILAPVFLIFFIFEKLSRKAHNWKRRKQSPKQVRKATDNVGSNDTLVDCLCYRFSK